MCTSAWTEGEAGGMLKLADRDYGTTDSLTRQLGAITAGHAKCSAALPGSFMTEQCLTKRLIWFGHNSD